MSTTTAPEGTALGYLIEATQEVFQTMILSELTIGVPIDGDALRPRSNVVATVSFAGPRSGIVALYTTLSTAQTLAAAMLGGPVDEQDQLADAVGELANMVAGTFRNHMAKDGSCWAISIPTVTIGSDFYVKCMSDGRRTLCPLRVDGEEIFVELILTNARAANAH